VSIASNRRMPAWRILALISAILLFLGLAILTWFYDTTDVAVVKARAKAVGLPTCWAETGRALISDERLATWKKIVSFKPRLRSYREINRWPSTPLVTDVAVLRAHHQSLPSDAIRAVLSLIDRLGSDELVLRSAFSMRDGLYPELRIYDSLSSFLSERLLLASDEDALAECRLLLGFTSTLEPTSLAFAFRRMKRLREILLCIAERVAVLKKHHAEISQSLTRLADQLDSNLEAGLEGEFLLQLDLADNPPSVEECTGFGAIGDGSWDTELTPWLFRAGRRYVLDTEIDWMLFLKSRPDLRRAIEHGQDIRGVPDQKWELHTRASRFLLHIVGYDLQAVRLTQLHVRLVIAELQQSAWPTDEFDPQHLPLRPVKRDGGIMGAYSVGTDGVDDGGVAHKDHYFQLYGPLEPPVSTGP